MSGPNICDAKRTKILKGLKALNEFDQEMLLDKYSQKTKDVYDTFKPQDYLDIKMDILILKYCKDALVDSYVNGDPVVDQPGHTLNEFLGNEMLKPN
jgi:hypothetical protein